VKILLTGVAGFIGSHLVGRLLARGDIIVGLDAFDETLYPAALHEANVAPFAGAPGFQLIRGDVCDAALLRRLFADARPDAIVHLGALAGVRPSLSQPLRYQKVNVEGTLLLLEAARASGVSRFIFASSSSVYGAHSPVPFRESDPAVRPASPYAATKRAGELFCANYADLYGMSTTALRFFTVYGPRQRPEMAIHKFARLILDRAPLPLYGDGSTARDYTYIDDILDGVMAALDRSSTPGRHAVYNLGGSQTTTLKRLVELLEASLGQRAKIEWLPDQPGDVPITAADVSLAERELGYAPKVTIEEGIARFAAWLRARG
jgi:UDP-glucuronate 4-epimerase